MWLFMACRARTLPLAVTLKRFFAPEWVFIFGMRRLVKHSTGAAPTLILAASSPVRVPSAPRQSGPAAQSAPVDTDSTDREKLDSRRRRNAAYFADLAPPCRRSRCY